MKAEKNPNQFTDRPPILQNWVHYQSKILKK